MLIIFSPASVDSKLTGDLKAVGASVTPVMDEVSFALEEKKAVIPIICKDCVAGRNRNLHGSN
jgi:hypothetical protein